MFCGKKLKCVKVQVMCCDFCCQYFFGKVKKKVLSSLEKRFKCVEVQIIDARICLSVLRPKCINLTSSMCPNVFYSVLKVPPPSAEMKKLKLV